MMKVGLGTGSNFNKNADQNNVKVGAKTSGASKNVLAQSLKDPKKKIMTETVRKSQPKSKLINYQNSDSNANGKNLATSANALPVTNPFQNCLKPNYKSTPIIKNANLNLNDESSGRNVVKEANNYYSTQTKNIMITDIGSNTNISPNKRTPTNAFNQVKNGYVNLWRKPVVLGGGTQTQVNSEGNSNVKSGLRTSKQKTITNLTNHRRTSFTNINNNSNFNNITNNNTNILTTNYTDNKKEAEFTVESNYKNSSPIHHYIETPKSKDLAGLKKLSDSPSNNNQMLKENYMTNYNTPNGNISNFNNNDIFQSEILSSIINFKTMLKSNDTTNNIEKLFQTEEHLDKIHELNNRLHMYGGGVNLNGNFPHPTDSKNLLNEYNIIKRDTFIETSVKKPINVISADMLMDHMTVKPKAKANRHEIQDKIKEEEELFTPETKNRDKDKVMNEIVTNSDLRIKRYGILLDFINSNLKEINQMVHNSNQNQNNTHARTRSVNMADVSKDLNKIEELNSNKFSSLHSKINLNSRTNLNYCEESDIQDRNNNFILPKNLKNESNIFSNFDFTEKEFNQFNKQNYDPSPSFLISSINSEFYQNLLEESYNYISNKVNLNDLSSVRTPNENKKLERMASYESDKTPLQYLQFQGMIKDNIAYKKSVDLNKLQPKYTEESVSYNEGDENLEDSDLDKTKEQVNVFVTKKQSHNQVIKDMERVNFFSSKNPKIDPQFESEIKEAVTSKSPDEKSKCLIY